MRQVPGQGRGTYAAEDLEPGDVLASIPVELAYAADYSIAPGFEAAGPKLVLDMADPNSFWQPYFSSLPELGQVLSKEFLPDTYFPIIQDENTETAIRMLQDNLQYFCQQLQPKYDQLKPGLNASHCAHGAALLSTRTFSYGGTEVLLPILDLANHDNACLHTHDAEPCDLQTANKLREAGLLPVDVPDSLGSGKVVPFEAEETATDSQPAAAAEACKGWKGGCDEQAGGSDGATADAKFRGVSGICIVWRAETEVAKGGEVCNNYGLLLQDNALFQYGYLQAGAIEQELSMLDRPEHSEKFEEVWDKPKGAWGQPLPHKFTGTAQEVQTELARLAQRLEELQAGEKAVASIKPHADDAGGRMLAMMLKWRQQRLRAVELEMQRLTALGDQDSWQHADEL